MFVLNVIHIRLVRYCECFQASIVCTERCRCMECKNFKGSELRNEAIQRLKEVDDDFYCSASVMSAELKRSHPSSSLVAFYSSQTSMLYEKLLDKVCSFFLYYILLCILMY